MNNISFKLINETTIDDNGIEQPSFSHQVVLNGNEIEGHLLDSSYFNLMNMKNHNSFDLFTCGCGSAGCAGFDQIHQYVDKENNKTYWIAPTSYSSFFNGGNEQTVSILEFDTNELNQVIENLINDSEKQIDSGKINLFFNKEDKDGYLDHIQKYHFDKEPHYNQKIFDLLIGKIKSVNPNQDIKEILKTIATPFQEIACTNPIANAQFNKDYFAFVDQIVNGFHLQYNEQQIDKILSNKEFNHLIETVVHNQQYQLNDWIKATEIVKEILISNNQDINDVYNLIELTFENKETGSFNLLETNDNNVTIKLNFIQ